ncbi:MAG: tetratricopeptide repeat protein [Bdellovibrionales bacterium]|nr:tetratricopeptide repeat protein [Bdellovibrionales bacterium]
MSRSSLMALAFIFSIFMSIQSYGSESESAIAKMDLQTHDALIGKLATVLPSLPDNSEQATTIKIRLGDLYSERARLKDIAAGEKNCTECKDAKKDRDKAIAYYLATKRMILSHIENLQRVNLQLANLYKLTNQIKSMEKTYKEILKDSRQFKIHSKAHLGIAEILFQNGDYRKAAISYDSALRRATPEDRAYIVFRQSWTAYNLGRSDEALRTIQKAIKQAQRLSLTAFHKDLMRDYATMQARNPFTSKDVDTYLAHSPEQDRVENLKFFGEEADRLGNKKGSLLIWTLLLRQDSSSQDSAEIQLKLAQNFYDLENYPQALHHLDQTVVFVQKKNCSDKKCESVKNDFKSLLVTWTKKEKTAPTEKLSLAYQKYISCNPEDFEVIVWAAQVAKQRNDSITAYELYEQAAIIAAKKKLKKELESSLVIAIEIAEESHNQALYERALRKYLELNSNGPLAYTVRYQLAYILYKSNKYAEAAEAFKRLALDSDFKDGKLRLQSAELSLDALKLIKSDREIREFSRLYAPKFPNRADHFNEIGRKVTINQIVLALKSAPVDDSLVRSELKILIAYPIKHLPTDDQATHYRTMILGSEKLKDLETISSSSKKLLAVRGITKNDIELAKKSLLWVHELKLEFREAYAVASDIPMKNLTQEQRSLRLGLLAELAGLNPEKHFNAFLRTARSSRNTNLIRIKLIRRNHYKWATYDRMIGQLRSNPDLLAQITLELHSQDPRPAKIDKALSVPGVRSTPEGVYLSNIKLRKNFQQFSERVHRHSIATTSDRGLQRGIKERMQLLEKLKNEYNEANQHGDIYLQVLALKTIAKENNRFYHQLTGLPTPKGLSQLERQTYNKLIQERAQPYQLASKEAETLLSNFFSINSQIIDKLKNSIGSEDPVARIVALSDYRALREFLPSSEASRFESEIKNLKVNPSRIEKARQNVEKNPLDPSTLEDLRELEAKRANGPLIAYLDERLSQIKSETRR